MQVALINGSPKRHRSASGCILKYLQPLLEQEGHVTAAFSLGRPELAPQDAKGIGDCDALIFALPLYVDGLPSHLVSCLGPPLWAVEESLARSGERWVYMPSVNCGFYEGH